MAETLVVGCVSVRNGRLHIGSEVYAGGLSGCTALALVVRDGQWLMLPLLGGAGGLHIKIRNARGDRVVEAQEFFRSQGLEDDHLPCEFELKHEPGLGAFRLLRKGG